LKNVLFYLILIIIFVALYGTYSIVASEWHNGQVCPTILGIPACYIIFTILITALVTHLMNNKWPDRAYYTVVIIALSIATYGSLGELMGFADCPETGGGIPMCFISFGIFLSLLLMKYFSLNYYLQEDPPNGS